MALCVEQILVGGFDENISYILYCDVTKEAFIIDPSGDFKLVVELVAALQLDVVAILLTHTHADHIDALREAQELFPVPVFVHEQGASTVASKQIQSLVDGNEIELGDDVVTVLHTPGHSTDSVCYMLSAKDEQLVLITGDTLFIDGCGRTTEQEVGELYDSLQFIKTVPPQTLILPGHNYGPLLTDTIANQLLTNRFLRAPNFSDFCLERLGYTINT